VKSVAPVAGRFSQLATQLRQRQCATPSTSSPWSKPCPPRDAAAKGRHTTGHSLPETSRRLSKPSHRPAKAVTRGRGQHHTAAESVSRPARTVALATPRALSTASLARSLRRCRPSNQVEDKSRLSRNRHTARAKRHTAAQSVTPSDGSVTWVAESVSPPARTVALGTPRALSTSLARSFRRCRPSNLVEDKSRLSRNRHTAAKSVTPSDGSVTWVAESVSQQATTVAPARAGLEHVAALLKPRAPRALQPESAVHGSQLSRKPSQRRPKPSRPREKRHTGRWQRLPTGNTVAPAPVRDAKHVVALFEALPAKGRCSQGSAHHRPLPSRNRHGAPRKPSQGVAGSITRAAECVSRPARTVALATPRALSTSPLARSFRRCRPSNHVQDKSRLSRNRHTAREKRHTAAKSVTPSDGSVTPAAENLLAGHLMLHEFALTDG
jgi:hypothetical protein